MSPERSKTPEGYPDVSGRQGIHQLRKSDVMVDPAPQGGVDIEAIREVAGMKFTESLVFRTGMRADCIRCEDCGEDCESGYSEAVVGGGHLLWEKPSDVKMSSPVLTVGEVVEESEELRRLAELSEKSRTELIANKFWDQLSPLLEKELATPEQMEAFLRNEGGMSFPIEIPENIEWGRVNWGRNGPDGTDQEKFDNERDKWFEKVISIVKQRVVDFMVKGWDVRACVPRWSPGYSVRNRLFDGDVPMRDGKPCELDRQGCGASDIQRNFPGWVSGALRLSVRAKESNDRGHDFVRIYLPTFVHDYEWSRDHDHSPSHFGGFKSLEVKERKQD